MLVKIHNFQKIQTSHLSLNHIPDFLNSWALLSISLSWPPLSSSSLISILTGSGSSLQLGSLRLRLIVDNRENIISNLWMFQKCTWQQLHHLPCKPQSLSFHHCPLNIHFEFQTQYLMFTFLATATAITAQITRKLLILLDLLDNSHLNPKLFLYSIHKC